MIVFTGRGSALGNLPRAFDLSGVRWWSEIKITDARQNSGRLHNLRARRLVRRAIRRGNRAF